MKRPVGRPKNPKTNATDRSRRGQVNYSDGISKTPADNPPAGNSQRPGGPVISDVRSLQPPETSIRHQQPQHNGNAAELSVEEQLPRELMKYEGSPSVQSLGATSATTLSNEGLLNVLEDNGEAIDPNNPIPIIDLVNTTPRPEDSLQSSNNDAKLAEASHVYCPTATIAATNDESAAMPIEEGATHSSANEPTTSGTVQPREEADGGASSSSQVNSQKGAAEKRKQSSDSAASETTKKSRCDEEMEKPWTCSLLKVAVSFKDYPKTLMTWQQFQSFKRDVVELMINSMDTGESLPSSARVIFKGGAAVFYCNNEESKSRLTRMLLEGDFLESRNLKILEDDEIPGCVKMVGLFVDMREPSETTLKMLGLQNEKLNTTRWIVNSVKKEDCGLELILEIDRGSFEFLKTCGFCLPFAAGEAYFKGPKDMWNDRCEEFLLCKQILEQSAAQYPSSKDRFKQLWKQRRSVLTQESKKSKDKASASANNIV